MSNISRRWFFEQCGVGLGAMAMNALAAANPQPHFAPKAKRVIFLFMAGAPSHLEMFDNKPQLAKFDGQLPPAELLKGYRAAFINPNSKLLGPKFPFARYGKSGAELSPLLPHLSKVVDDITIVKSMSTDAFNHAPGQLMMNTGAMIFGRPSIGSWVTYGLGSESKDLPAFVVFSTGKKGPSGGNSCWGSGFLPTTHQGVQFRSTGDPVLYLSNPAGVDNQLQQDSLAAIKQLNQRKLDSTGDPEIATRISSYEMAYRMQMSAPGVMDLSQEPKHILDLYGADPAKPSFANTVLLARRLSERGVRFVQIFHEAWDQHGNLVKDITQNCKDTDQACAALVQDLKQRGMLDDTIVIWGGEFGRTPMVQGGSDGRDHHPNAFTMWLAGGGFKPGITYGETDELGFNVARDKVHVHDLHATILNQLGFDHTKLTYKFQGRNFRLTDVHGEVKHGILS
ncbi:MAG: DUF1501 domain-containing protein [Acidobacteriota bacterium]|jgi:uncharacterized protein (DUF1501 family)|nr:DUF1501 domain-containing protein [Bryobacteraceae bacterium CoA2 C42]MCA2965221.1 DUF1501 domain-containing protein [Acidobacteriaceae bacterium]